MKPYIFVSLFDSIFMMKLREENII